MKSFCTNCGHLLDSTTGVTEDRDARPGDISVCAYCGQVSSFDKDLRLKKISDEEMAEMKVLAPETWFIIRMTVEAIRKRVAVD